MRSPASLLLAILAIVLSATALPQPQGQTPPPANNGTANAGRNSTAPAAGNSTLPGGAASGFISIFFGQADKLPPACFKLVTETVQPLLLDPECDVVNFVTGTPSNSSALEPKLTKLCGKSCTDKAQAALKAISQVPECGNQATFGTAVVAAFYHYNNYCITSPKGNAFCTLEQSKALEEAKVAANATTDAWPQPVLCSECTQKQYRLLQMQSSFASLTVLSSRSNPASNKTLLTAKCGEEWIKTSEKIELQLAVKAESGASSSGGAGTAAGADKPSGAGKAVVTVSSVVLAAVAALLTVAL